MEKALAWLEKVGNKLPDPLTLFVLFSLTVIISAIASALQVSVVHPGTKEGKALITIRTRSKAVCKSL
ncbi:AbgT family transporter [Scytonema millei]|uniref:Uncharacterized protein n=1 Tax=Scytonema millei VB511283 TaxID=1245923 RepID=A0A9X5I861_9CYAN|nr:AbgT family transporter [Scytonema millei]NHC37817.1 hypothetical protein [Scytonema millei VB511283]